MEGKSPHLTPPPLLLEARLPSFQPQLLEVRTAHWQPLYSRRHFRLLVTLRLRLHPFVGYVVLPFCQPRPFSSFSGRSRSCTSLQLLPLPGSHRQSPVKSRDILRSLLVSAENRTRGFAAKTLLWLLRALCPRLMPRQEG